MRSGGFADMTTSRFEVFNVETGEAVQTWAFPVPEIAPRYRRQAFAHARQYVLDYSRMPYGIRLWERGNPVPTIVYSPHNL